MKEKFVDHKFNAASLKVIEIANGILNEYRAMGYRLSLRQLYYQLVARDYIENSVKSYKRIGNLISDARLAGLVDWGDGHPDCVDITCADRASCSKSIPCGSLAGSALSCGGHG